MIERNPIVVILLCYVSCGLYGLYHTMKTTEELVNALGRDDINPTTELVINLITCGLFGMYVEYRNQQLIDQWFSSQNLSHPPKADQVGILNLATFFVGLTWLMATFIYQDELNRMIAAMGQGAAAPAPAQF